MSFQFQWTTTPEQMLGDLAENYAQRIEAGIVTISDHYAPQVEAYMKANHLWQNRTGAAEAGLYTEVNHVVREMVEIILGGRADHQIWLEVRWAGRFAIIAPTIDVYAPQIWADVVAMLR